jgi:hypothetical protein
VSLFVRIYECNACGQRYPIMPYYPVAAPHGPDKKCRGDLGWSMVTEELVSADAEEE